MNKVDLKILIAVAILVLAGCATTGTGPKDAASPDVMPEPKVDIRNQMGENGLLTPAAILARYVEVSGGEKAMRAHSSSTIKGRMEMPSMGVEGDMVIYAAAPDKMVMNIELGGVGTMNQGYNGQVGWSDNPMTGPSLLEGDMLKQLQQQADFYLTLNYDTHYPTQETLGLVEWNGESALKIRLVDTEGKESFHYFSEESSYLIGTEGMQASEMGEVEVKTRLGDYKEFDGVQTPTALTMEFMGMQIIQTINEVTFDTVAAGDFEPPSSIKALME